jgi:DNA-3-methyladenine glycosylase
MNAVSRLQLDFYTRDVLIVAPELLGKELVIANKDGSVNRFCIADVEAYRGEEDKACHASKGRTGRTDIMYHSGGNLYVYLIYGMYWMLNIVTGKENDPQAVLIRGVEKISGPGRITKTLGIDRSFNRESLIESDRIWIENTDLKPQVSTGPRIGIDYAGDYWKNVPWRFYFI